MRSVMGVAAPMAAGGDLGVEERYDLEGEFEAALGESLDGDEELASDRASEHEDSDEGTISLSVLCRCMQVCVYINIYRCVRMNI